MLEMASVHLSNIPSLLSLFLVLTPEGNIRLFCWKMLYCFHHQIYICLSETKQRMGQMKQYAKTLNKGL